MVGNKDFGGVLVVDQDILEPHVLESLNLPVVQRPVKREAERVTGVEASSAAETQGHLRVEASAIQDIGSVVLGDVDHHYEGHASDAT